MGVSSFLFSVLRASSDGFNPDTAAAANSSQPACAHVAHSRVSTDSSVASLEDTTSPPHPNPVHLPGARRRVTFTLSLCLYRWLEAAALRHNYGSVHKSVRDLLEWARTGDETDMEWLFCAPHKLPPIRPDPPPVYQQQQPLASDSAKGAPTSSAAGSSAFDVPTVITDASCIARRCTAAAARTSPLGPVTLDAFICESLYLWVTGSVRRYGMRGPSDVLDAVIRSVIELGADDDVFESDECGHDLPVSTAELYHDLGLLRFAPLSPVGMGASTNKSGPSAR